MVLSLWRSISPTLVLIGSESSEAMVVASPGATPVDGLPADADAPLLEQGREGLGRELGRITRPPVRCRLLGVLAEPGVAVVHHERAERSDLVVGDVALRPGGQVPHGVELRFVADDPAADLGDAGLLDGVGQLGEVVVGLVRLVEVLR